MSNDLADILSVLIWVQTVCKGYQQTTNVAVSSDSVSSLYAGKFCTLFCHPLNFFSHNYHFQTILSRIASIRVSNSLEPDQDQRFVRPAELFAKAISCHWFSKSYVHMCSVLIMTKMVFKNDALSGNQSQFFFYTFIMYYIQCA